MTSRFQADQAAMLLEGLASGRISRRRFIAAAGALAALPVALRADLSLAAAKQIVLVNWGGDAMTAYARAYGDPFTATSGIPVLMDGSGPTEGAIRAQVASGNPAWDLVDVDPFSGITLGKEGALRPIDYKVVDRSKFRPGFGWDHATVAYFFSYVICYNAEKYGANVPTGMADFFDVTKFPGKRAMYKWGVSSWEAALLADGVARAALYPLDIDRAHKKIAAFKDNVSVFWGGGAELQSAMLNGDADMAIAWNTRAKLIEQDSGGKVKYVWNDGLLQAGSFGVLANNPAGEAPAMQLLAAMQDPARQLTMFELLGQGPASPAADALIPADAARHNCVAPGNAALQIPLDMEWYAAKYGPSLDAYLAIVSA